MLAARIYTEEAEIDLRLAAFGVSRQELLHVVMQVVAAKADTTDDDPVSAGGQFAYIHGTRNLRALFKRKKWLLHREQNIESVKHPDRPWHAVYQNVDLAAYEHRPPQAISGKGAGADRAIHAGQGFLFSREQLAASEPIHPDVPIDSGVWFFCVSVDGDDVRAELSLPSAIEGGNFKGFLERIFIVGDGEWQKPKIVPVADDVVEFEPKVTRRT